MALKFLDDIQTTQKIFGHPIEELSNFAFFPVLNADYSLNQTIAISEEICIKQGDFYTYFNDQMPRGTKSYMKKSDCNQVHNDFRYFITGGSLSETERLIQYIAEEVHTNGQRCFYLVLTQPEYVRDRTGHGLGLYVDKNNKVFFCDANYGIFKFSNLNSFQEWFAWFLSENAYKFRYDDMKLYSQKPKSCNMEKVALPLIPDFSIIDAIEQAELNAQPHEQNLAQIYLSEMKREIKKGLREFRKAWVSLEVIAAYKQTYGASIQHHIESAKKSLRHLDLRIERLEAKVDKNHLQSSFSLVSQQKAKHLLNPRLKDLISWIQELDSTAKSEGRLRIGFQDLDKEQIKSFNQGLNKVINDVIFSGPAYFQELKEAQYPDYQQARVVKTFPLEILKSALELCADLHFIIRRKET